LGIFCIVHTTWCERNGWYREEACVSAGFDRFARVPNVRFSPLEVARNEGCSLGDLRKATGMPLPTLSRMLWALSTKRQTGAEPYGLIEQDYSAENHRRKVIRLSAKGRRLISRLNAIIDQTAA
jgi:hypothetical protein